MPTTRLEAFSDGVMAILITIMVLELHAPAGIELVHLKPLWPTFLSYLLSFLYLAIYWNNHHHLLHGAAHVSGAVLWANMHLLFWLSLFPFTTAWVGRTSSAPWPTAVYGIVLFLAAIAYMILEKTLMVQRKNTALARALGNTLKEKISPLIYLAGIGAAFIKPWASNLLYLLVALLWLAPDRRIEKMARS